MSKIPTNKLSIYLIKDEYSDPKDILKDCSNLESQEIDGVGVFYFDESHKFLPSWLKKFFGPPLSDTEKLFNYTSKGVLLTSVNFESDQERIFAIPFGYGRMLLNPGVYEQRFGLKIVLNIVDSARLRKIDKTNMATVPKNTSEQLSQVGMAADFGIDVEQDLIRSITGKTKIEYKERFGETVAGKDALSVSCKVNSTSIIEFLKECFARYRSDSYKEQFKWIDQISEIRDPKVIEGLNDKLIEKIKLIQGDMDEDGSKTWMAVPEIVEWSDVRGFTYGNKRKGSKNYEEHDDIYLYSFLDSLLEDEKSNLSLELLKKKEIVCYSASSDDMQHKWRAYDCLYCEISYEEKTQTFVLSNGSWYEIETDFADAIDKDYKLMSNSKAVLDLPDYVHENENEYNEKVAEGADDFCCMDKKMIMHGGGHSKIEFCDLFTEGKMIVHVKRYGGSSVLSHLFSQGVVSGELFISEENFRKEVNKKLPNSHKIENVSARPDASDYQVIFAIISKKGRDLELPFFSKVSLRNAKRRLEAFGYKVALQKIKVNKSNTNGE